MNAPSRKPINPRARQMLRAYWRRYRAVQSEEMGLRAKVAHVEMVLNQIDDEHEATRYCRDDVCAVCSIIGRLNDAILAAQKPERVGTLGDDETCRRCGGENVTWCAPSPLWNLVMRGNDINAETVYADLVCIRCFIVMAKGAGVRGQWRVYVTPEPEGLQLETPSGRVWDSERWLWVEPRAQEGN